MAKEFFLTLDKPRKIVFRYRDVQDAVESSGKSLIQLLNDDISGWPHLLLFGLRYHNPNINKSLIAQYLDTFIERKQDEGVESPLQEIGEFLQDALYQCGFVKLERAKGAAGNAPAPETPGE